MYKKIVIYYILTIIINKSDTALWIVELIWGERTIRHTSCSQCWEICYDSLSFIKHSKYIHLETLLQRFVRAPHTVTTTSMLTCDTGITVSKILKFFLWPIIRSTWILTWESCVHFLCRKLLFSFVKWRVMKGCTTSCKLVSDEKSSVC